MQNNRVFIYGSGDNVMSFLSIEKLINFLKNIIDDFQPLQSHTLNNGFSIT